MSGLLTFPFNSLYHASKWAVEGFSESLTYELESFGIQVKLLEPGAVSTNFFGSSLQISKNEALTAYDEKWGIFNKNKSAADSGSISADQMATYVFEAATDGKKQLRYIIGEKTNQLVGMRKAKGDDAYMDTIKQFLAE
jgi:short-subunit dehydrogenase